MTFKFKISIEPKTFVVTVRNASNFADAKDRLKRATYDDYGVWLHDTDILNHWEPATPKFKDFKLENLKSIFGMK